MSSYYTGISLFSGMTGFGVYTGIALINSGNFPIAYTATISDTTLLGIDISTGILDGSNTNTIFVCNDLSDVDINNSSINIAVNPSESGILYIANKPFKDFSASYLSTGVISGFEKATLTIESLSSVGDQDENIIIDITGRRMKLYSPPPKIGSFYAVEDYNSTNGFFRNFYWKVPEPSRYATGFNLELSTTVDFSSPTVYQYSVAQNSSLSLPLYGSYKTLSDIQFNERILNLEKGQSYYARIQGVNPSGTGEWSYATGFDNYNVTLDGIGYSGLYPSPGGDLQVNLKKLNLVRLDDYEIDFDLYSFIVKQNKNSLDFGRYSGINIKFGSNNQGICKYIASSVDKGAINFNIPQNGDLILGSAVGNKFIIELEFENCGLFGHGGEGLKWIGASAVLNESDYVNPKDGGPIFNLDSSSISSFPIEYYIYKDVDSVFYAGPGGGKGWLINDDTATALDTSAIRIDGVKIFDLSDYILPSPTP